GRLPRRLGRAARGGQRRARRDVRRGHALGDAQRPAAERRLPGRAGLAGDDGRLGHLRTRAPHGDRRQRGRVRTDEKEHAMKGIVHHAYGGPEALRIGEADRPSPGAGEVLVRVRASSVNFGDVVLARGEPLAARLVFGMTRPRHRVPGHDLAGVVEETGPGVTRFATGDEVFAEVPAGAWAEYALVPEKDLAARPRGVSFEEAAAVPVAGNTALLGLRDAGRLKAGQSVLVNGASGGVGTFAVQLAKAMGAEVTGVCRAGNAELVRSLGADEVVDYTREDFVAAGRRF